MKSGWRFRMRWWGWTMLALMVIAPVAALVWLHHMVAAWQPPPLEMAFQGLPLPSTNTLALPGGRRIHYGETGRADGPLVLLVHGTPGGWQDFFSVMKRLEFVERVRVVSVDRPGWGESAQGGLVSSLQEQAAAIAAVLRKHPQNRPAILVGHSLGGAIAPRVAIDFPELVDGVVIVAGSIDPDLEVTTWYQAVARSVLVKWAIPEPLTRSNDEMKPLKAELTAMVPLWSGLRCPVIVVQGDDDALVPPANAAFAERVIMHAPLTVHRIPHQGHLIPWERPELITDAVLELLAKIDRSAGGDGDRTARADHPVR